MDDEMEMVVLMVGVREGGGDTLGVGTGDDVGVFDVDGLLVGVTDIEEVRDTEADG